MHDHDSSRRMLSALLLTSTFCLFATACGDDLLLERSEGDEGGGGSSSSPTWLSADPGESGGGESAGEERGGEGTGGLDGHPSSSPADSPSREGGGGLGSSSGEGNQGDDGAGSGSGSGGSTSGGGTSGGDHAISGEGHIAMLTRRAGGTYRPYWMNQLLITGTPGRLSCLAVKDQGVLPAGAGYQYIVVLDRDDSTPGTAGGGYCPVGEYVMEGGGDCGNMAYYNIAAEYDGAGGCAGYREWDGAGDVEYDADPIARSGLVLVEETSRGCEVHVELHFSSRASLLGSYLLPDTSEEVSCGASF